METIQGKNFFNTYRQKHPREYLQFLTNFEKAKKAFKGDGKITIALPWAMGHLYMEMHAGKKIERVLKAAEGVSFSSDMISIKPEIAKNFFEQTIHDIANHVECLLREEKLNDLKYILMVGGFSKCEVLQQTIREKFERNGIKVLIPSEAQLAIIKGAVLFGHQPTEISKRILKLSYGYSVDPEFVDGYHDSSRIFLHDNGKYYCRSVFEYVATKGTVVSEGESFQSKCTSKGNKNLRIQLFVTNEPKGTKPKYIDDSDVTKVGKLAIKSDAPSVFAVSFEFGGTEIQVKTINLNNGEEAATVIDFLS